MIINIDCESWPCLCRVSLIESASFGWKTVYVNLYSIWNAWCGLLKISILLAEPLPLTRTFVLLRDRAHRLRLHRRWYWCRLHTKCHRTEILFKRNCYRTKGVQILKLIDGYTVSFVLTLSLFLFFGRKQAYALMYRALLYTLTRWINNFAYRATCQSTILAFYAACL